MIPDDVTVQVLTQAREHIIKRTFEAVQEHHVCDPRSNSTSVAQRTGFQKDKEQVKQIAIDGDKAVETAC